MSELETGRLVARLLLAAMFGVAGVSKMADLQGSRKSLAEFGVPVPLVPWLAVLLPVSEVAVAAALIPQRSAWHASIAAAILLLGFMVAICVNLARGRTPDCHCFGQLHSAPISGWLVARNGAMVVLAGLVVGGGPLHVGPSAVRWLAAASVAEIVHLALGLTIVGGLLVVVGRLRRLAARQDEILHQLAALQQMLDVDDTAAAPHHAARPPSEGLPVGSPAPPFSLQTLTGRAFTLADLCREGHPVLLLFVSPGCAPCQSLQPLLKSWQRDHPDVLTVALLTSGSVDEARTKLAAWQARYLLLLGESDVAATYRASWTPSAVLISSDGRIASSVKAGEKAILALVDRVAADAHSQRFITTGSPFRIGEEVPKFVLPDLQGGSFTESSFGDRGTLLVFWDAQCGHCRSISQDLAEWQATDAADLIYVVNQPPDESSRVRMLVDSDFGVVRALFGVSGTPSALLVDGNGRVASSLATGPSAVLALVGLRRRDAELKPS